MNPNCCGSMICGDDPSNPDPDLVGEQGICRDEGKRQKNESFVSINVLILWRFQIIILFLFYYRSNDTRNK